MNQAIQAALLTVAGWSIRWHVADARPAFAALIPNGNGPLGHANGIAGGPLNAFGVAFEAAGRQWTQALCQLDSDGDGATNGEELGDPCCRWTLGSAPLGTAVAVTRPGEADAFTAAQLAAMKCAEAQDVSIADGAPLVPEEDGSAAMSLEPDEEGSVGGSGSGSGSGSADGDVSLPDAGSVAHPHGPTPAPTPGDAGPSEKSAAAGRFPVSIAVLVAIGAAAQMLA